MAPKSSHTTPRRPITQPTKSPRPAPAKTPKRNPGQSRYAQPGERGGWYWTAWHYRRSLKISSATTAAQDIARCYAAMTPKMYAQNLVVKEEQKPGQNRLGHRHLHPTDYEQLLLSKHTPKKEARGSENVGRKKTSVSRMFRRKAPTTAKHSITGENSPRSEEKAPVCEVKVASRSSSAISDQNRSQSSHSANTERSQLRTKRLRHVRFNEDLDWVDLDDAETSNCFGEEEDEYILL